MVITRRTLLKSASSLASVAAFRSARAADSVKIGLISTLSGPNAVSGEMIRKAAELYLAKKAASAGGATVELIIRDDGGPNPEVAKRLVQELVVGNKVQYLAGIVFTPNANAIAPLVTQAKLPCVLTNSGGAATTRLSPYFVRTSFTNWQTCYTLGQWAVRNGYKRVSTLVADFVAGIDMENAFVAGFKADGTQIVNSDHMPLINPNFVPFLERVKRDKPDALFAFNAGGTQMVPFLKAYNELGLKAAGIKLLGPGDITDDIELRNSGSLGEGVITAHVYSPIADRPSNHEFIRLWHEAYGADAPPPNFIAAGTWDGMQAIFDAIKATGGAPDPVKALDALSHFRSDTSPKGVVSIDPETRDIVQDVHIREVRLINGVPGNVEFDTIPAVKDPWKILNPA